MSRKLLHVVLSFVLLVSALVLVVGQASAADPQWPPPVWEPNYGSRLDLSDDGSSVAIDLGFEFYFYGEKKTQVYVNSNGNLSFGAANPYGGEEGTPFPDQFWYSPIPDADKIIIAPIYGDFKPDAVVAPDGVWYNNTLIDDDGYHVFVATWSEVPEYVNAQKSTFQVQLLERPEGKDQILFGYNHVGTDGFNYSSQNPGDEMNVGIGFDNGSYINSASGDAIPGLDGTNICYAPSLGDYIQFDGECGTMPATAKATITLDEANVFAVEVDDQGDSPAFSLKAFVEEETPDAVPPHIDKAEVKMTLMEAESGDSYPVRCSNVDPIVGDILEAQCDFDNVAVGTYDVQAEVVGGYYWALTPAVGALVVYEPILGSTSGKGSFSWPDTGDETDFTFTMSYDNKGQPKGRMTLVRYAADGGKHKVSSKAIHDLTFGPSPDAGVYWARFEGECVYVEPGSKRAPGTFVVYVEDHGGTGDRFWIEVRHLDDSVIEDLSMAPPEWINAVMVQGDLITVTP